MRRLFMASTPFQIWNTVLMAKKLFCDDENDLLVIDHFPDARAVASRLSSAGVFSHVNVVSSERLDPRLEASKPKRLLKKMLITASWKKTVRRFVPLFGPYDAAFVSCDDVLRNLILCYLKRDNPDLEACFFEDGAVDYIDVPHFGVQKGLVGAFQKLFRFCYVTPSIRDDYVLAPGLVVNKQYTYHTIPIIEPGDTELVGLMNTVFPCGGAPSDEKAVFLYGRSIPEESHAGIVKLIHETSAHFDGDLLVKDHPRTPAAEYADLKHLETGKSTLWESFVMNYDLSDRVLISHISTALFTPKVMFGQEPYLVFLFKMYEMGSLKIGDREAAFETYVENLRRTYRDPERICVPTSREEYFSFLERVMKERRS